jgi:hypothetical protein
LAGLPHPHARFALPLKCMTRSTMAPRQKPAVSILPISVRTRWILDFIRTRVAEGHGWDCRRHGEPCVRQSPCSCDGGAESFRKSFDLFLCSRVSRNR